MTTSPATKEPDVYVMYLIVRESLKMSPGKIGAQCGHAAQLLQMKFNEMELDIQAVPDAALSDALRSNYENWLEQGYRKVVLKADEKEWVKVKALFHDYHKVVVVDAGFTELEPNTETVIGLMPLNKNDVPKLVKRLQVL